MLRRRGLSVSPRFLWEWLTSHTVSPFPALCAPQKVDPALIARFRPAMLGCFVPVDLTTPPAS